MQRILRMIGRLIGSLKAAPEIDLQRERLAHYERVARGASPLILSARATEDPIVSGGVNIEIQGKSGELPSDVIARAQSAVNVFCQLCDYPVVTSSTATHSQGRN